MKQLYLQNDIFTNTGYIFPNIFDAKLTQQFLERVISATKNPDEKWRKISGDNKKCLFLQMYAIPGAFHVFFVADDLEQNGKNEVVGIVLIWNQDMAPEHIEEFKTLATSINCVASVNNGFVNVHEK